MEISYKVSNLETELKMIKMILSDRGCDNYYYYSKLILTESYYRRLEFKEEEKLNHCLRYARMDESLYEMLLILEFKNYNFENCIKLVEFCLINKFYKSLNFIRYKNEKFYTNLKIISPELLEENIFIESETMSCLYTQLKKYGFENLNEKFEEIKQYVKQNEIFSIKYNFNIEDFNTILNYSQDAIDMFIIAFESNQDDVVEYFTSSYDYSNFFNKVIEYLEKNNYKEYITFDNITPNEKIKKLVTFLNELSKNFNLNSCSEYNRKFFQRIEFTSKENIIKNEMFDLILKKDYIGIRKEIDKNNKMKIFVKDSIKEILKGVDNKGGLLFIKFLLNRNIVNSQELLELHTNINNKEMQYQLLNHLEKIEANLKVNLEKAKMNASNNDTKYYVYFLYNNDSLSYIGKTCDLKSRLSSHKTHSHIAQEIIELVNVVKYIEFNTENEASIYEIYYIDKLNPKFNTEYNKSKGLSFNIPEKKFKNYPNW